MIQQHENHIRRCIELAKQGEGHVSPNPLVGAVVLSKDGNVVGEGFHEKYGEAHAEINALNQAGDNAKDGTIYINLEPCSHYGKTPPCVDRVIASGVKTLVIGMTDPNPEVAGRGIQKAKEAGIEVIEDVLNEECKKLNEIFIKNITEQKTFVAIKTASTVDGNISTYSGKSKWITSETARNEVHRLRNKYDAIMTGSKTVMIDNPSLTCRISGGRNPVRIVIDSKLITSLRSKVYQQDDTRVIIATAQGIDEKRKQRYPEHVEFIECPLLNGKINLEFLLKELHKIKIYSIIVESGAHLNGALLENDLIDKFYFFIAPKIMGDPRALSSFVGFNTENPDQCKQIRFCDVKSFPPDVMIEGYST